MEMEPSSSASVFEQLPFGDSDDHIPYQVSHTRPTPNSDTPSKPLKDRRTKRERASYWDRLPPEIVAEIFVECLPLRRERRLTRKKAPILLTRVCRVWYKLAVNLPRLWSTIVLTANGQSSIPEDDLCSAARFFEMCIARSKATPIELRVRADFLSHTAILDHTRHISNQMSHFTIIFPPMPTDLGHDDRPSYFPSSNHLSMPSLTAFEVHNQDKHNAISIADVAHMEAIITSSRTLKSGIFCSRQPGPRGPLILHNSAHLEVLSLGENLPLSACLFLLRAIPTLRELSLLKVVMHPEHMAPLENQTGAMSFNFETLQPFTHSRLKCLALAYCAGDPSAFFKFTTLPALRYLVIDLRGDDKVFWPHANFMSFLRRSDCKLGSFTIIDQPMSPSQLLEILQFPGVGNSIDSLSIQNYRNDECVIDDRLLERLTAGTGSADKEDLPHGAEELVPPLCPLLEDIALFLPLEKAIIHQLVRMFKARTSQGGTSLHGKSFQTLRRVQMDLSQEMKPYLADLVRGGLILRLYEQDQYDPPPIGKRQLKLLRRYLNGRGKSVVFEHDTGKWDGLLLDE